MSDANRQQYKEDCVRESLVAGAKASAFALAVSSLSVGLANHFLPAFRSSLGVSGKTALIAVVLCIGQLPNLRDQALLNDPVHGVSDGHFYWGSFFYGYLIYDSLYGLLMTKSMGRAAFIIHHGLSFFGLAVGLYFRKLAIFGIHAQVILESTTPLLNFLGCLKIFGKENTRLYKNLALTFVAQFFLFRIVMTSALVWWMTKIVANSQLDIWAWSGCITMMLLLALNTFWFFKLILMLKSAAKQRAPKSAKEDRQLQFHPT